MKVLITGAHSKIATTVGEALQARGDVVTFTTSQSPLENPAHVFFDLHRLEESEASIDRYLEGGADALILCAATPSPDLRKAAAIPLAQANDFLQANIMGNYWLVRKFLPVFKAKGFGRLIFMSSMCTARPLQGYSVYAMAKSAIEMLMKQIALEYGKHNIYANSLRLGVFSTDRNAEYLSHPEIVEKITASVQLGRLGARSEITPVVEMLLNPSCYIQGTTIDVAGGL